MTLDELIEWARACRAEHGGEARVTISNPAGHVAYWRPGVAGAIEPQSATEAR